MSGLAAFWRARLDEDEAEAKATADADAEFWADVKGDGTHFARHDPARVLREVKAGRVILAEYERLDGDPARLTDTAMHLCWTVLGNVVRIWAAVCRDHPDYRQEWKP